MKLTLNCLRTNLVFATISLLSGSAAAQSWWSHDGMPTARHRLGVAAAKHNTSNYGIFAFGGTNGGLTKYKKVEMFNPLDATWSLRGDMPSELLAMATATAESSGGERVYLFGGATGPFGSTTAWEFDAVADAWNTALPPLPQAASYLSAATATNGLVYVFGGQLDAAPYYSNKVWAFDPMLGIWNTDGSWGLSIPDMPRRRGKHAAVAGCDGLIYLVGGVSTTGAVIPMDVFNPDTNAWVPLNPITSTAWAGIPGARDLEVSATMGRDGKLYMVGGEGYPYETGVLDSYNRMTNTWTSETPQPTTRNGQVIIGVSNAVYAIGGWKKFGGVQTATESFGGLPNQPDCGGIVHVNPPGVIYCHAAPNSINQGGALIDAEGFQSASMAHLALSAGPMPPSPGLFFYGANKIQAPFGDGFRCVGGSLTRLPVSVAQNGYLRTVLDFSGTAVQPSDFQPGQTINFQAWYRDTQGGEAGFNLSNGYTVHFMP